MDADAQALQDDIARAVQAGPIETRALAGFLLGWKIDPQATPDKDGNIPAIRPDGLPGVMPHFEEDLGAAWALAERYGLGLLPVERKGDGFDWVATNLAAAFEKGELSLDSSGSHAFFHPHPAWAICKAALVIELLFQYANEHPEDQPSQSPPLP